MEIDIENLDNILEAMMFVSGNSVDIAYIQDKLQLQDSELTKSLKRLENKFSGASGIHMRRYNGKVQFSTNPAYADAVSEVLNPIRERELSKATLEAVAIIAYKQPITRLEVEDVRGVNSDYAISVLLKNNLIKAVGRKDAIGKPFLFGTTEDFLKRFQLASIDELPSYEDLIMKIEVLNAPRNEALYNRFEIEEETESAKEDEIPDFLQGENIEIIE